MDSDFDYEIYANDGSMRTKGRKNRQSKEFKKFVKSGIVRKLSVSDENGALRDPLALPDADQFDLEFSVPYSLNKKGRWAKIPTMRSVDELEDQMGTKVSTIENIFLSSPRCGSHKGMSRAYHEVNESGEVVSKHSKRFLAQEKTLTEKPRLPRKMQKETKTDEPQDKIPAAVAHIRYETNIPHPSEKYWQQMSWRQHDYRPADAVFNTRARQISERELSLNSLDEDYFSNSDTESDATEEGYSDKEDGLSKRQQFSLFDYITATEKKPKRSESFVFLNAP